MVKIEKGYSNWTTNYLIPDNNIKIIATDSIIVTGFQYPQKELYRPNNRSIFHNISKRAVWRVLNTVSGEEKRYSYPLQVS